MNFDLTRLWFRFEWDYCVP